MPTLETIQGSSLQPKGDIVGSFAEGALQGELIRKVQEGATIADLQKAAAAHIAAGGSAATVPTIPQGGTTGAPGGVATGTGSAAGGAGLPTAKGPGSLQTAFKTGQVSSTHSGVNLESMQQQVDVMRASPGGEKAATQLQLVVDNANARIDKELENVSRWAGSLLEAKEGDLAVMLADAKSNSGGDAALLAAIGEVEKMKTFDQKQLKLKQIRDRSITALEDRKQDIQERKATTDESLARTRAVEATTAQTNAQTRLKELALDEREFRQVLEDYMDKQPEEQRKLAGLIIKPEVQKAAASVSAGTKLLDVNEEIGNMLEIQLLKGRNDLGYRKSAAEFISRIDPSQGKVVAKWVNTPNPGDIAEIDSALKAITLDAVNAMEKPSDIDLLTQQQTQADLTQNPDIDSAIAINNRVRERINRTNAENAELVKITNERGPQAGLALLNNRIEHRDLLQFARDAIAQNADPDEVMKILKKKGVDMRGVDL